LAGFIFFRIEKSALANSALYGAAPGTMCQSYKLKGLSSEILMVFLSGSNQYMWLKYLAAMYSSENL
jgi:hypothetical protein